MFVLSCLLYLYLFFCQQFIILFILVGMLVVRSFVVCLILFNMASVFVFVSLFSRITILFHLSAVSRYVFTFFFINIFVYFTCFNLNSKFVKMFHNIFLISLFESLVWVSVCFMFRKLLNDSCSKNCVNGTAIRKTRTTRTQCYITSILTAHID